MCIRDRPGIVSIVKFQYCNIAQHYDQLPRHLGVYSYSLVKARRPDGVLKACLYTPIYTLMASQHAWPRNGRGCFHNPTSYLVEMCLSCNFFSDLMAGRGLGLWPPTNRGLPPNISYFYAMLSAVYAVVVCLSVCLSHSGIVSKWLNVGSRK